MGIAYEGVTAEKYLGRLRLFGNATPGYRPASGNYATAGPIRIRGRGVIALILKPTASWQHFKRPASP